MSSVGEEEQRGRLSRKSFLGKIGAGAVAVGAAGGLGAASAEGAARLATGHGRAGINTQHFGRIFERMEPFAVPGNEGLEAALVDIGSPGGILDARDALDRGPVDLIADLSLSAHNPNNPTHTAGTTFFGQFMDHDMTFDLASPLGKPRRRRSYRNGRTPSFDLDSVYGAGPVGSPQLYDPARPGEAEGRVGRTVRGRAADAGRHGDHGRSPQRRARDHRRATGGLPALPQQRRRSTAGGRHD